MDLGPFARVMLRALRSCGQGITVSQLWGSLSSVISIWGLCLMTVSWEGLYPFICHLRVPFLNPRFGVVAFTRRLAPETTVSFSAFSGRSPLGWGLSVGPLYQKSLSKQEETD